MALTFHTFKFLERLHSKSSGFGETLSLGKINNLINKEDFKNLGIPESKDTYSDKILLKNFDIKSLSFLDLFENLVFEFAHHCVRRTRSRLRNMLYWLIQTN